MSKDIFMADYSECRDTNREIQSNITYIKEIISRLKKMDNHVQKVNTPSDVWNKSNYESDFWTINRYLNEEENRYTNFHSTFDAFYTPLEKVDAGLKSMLENALNFIEENKEYGVYVTVIKNSEVDEIEDGIYDELIKQGKSKEEALKISALANEDTQDLINELLKLEQNELQSKIDEIKHKVNQSPSELILLDILSLDQPNTYSDTLKDLSKEFASGGLVGVLQSGILNKSLDKYNLDIKSLTGQIDKLYKQIANGNLSSAKISIKAETMEKLKIIRESKISKVEKFETTKGNLSEISKWLGRASTAYNIGKISYTEWKDYTENGVELDDAIADAGIEWGGVMASAAGGAIATAKVGAVLGTDVCPIVGTSVGLVAGFFGGALVGFGYGLVVKPIVTEAYKDIVKPVDEWIDDKENDIGDWWDSLWW